MGARALPMNQEDPNKTELEIVARIPQRRLATPEDVA
jgi:hypothetical protein